MIVKSCCDQYTSVFNKYSKQVYQSSKKVTRKEGDLLVELFFFKFFVVF